MLVVRTMAETDEPAGPPITLIDPIDVSKLDKKFREEIQSMPEGEELSACFACSTCTAACPIANIWEYKPHQLIRMIILGMREEVLSSDEIWLCLTCFQCQERCPQKVAPVEVLFALKNMAVASGKQIPGNYTALFQSVLSIGLIQDVKSVTTRDNKTKNRTDLGLPEISKPTDSAKFQMILSKLAVEKV